MTLLVHFYTALVVYYYSAIDNEGSAHAHIHPRSTRIACFRGRRMRTGSHVPVSNLLALRRHALPLVMRDEGVKGVIPHLMRLQHQSAGELKAPPSLITSSQAHQPIESRSLNTEASVAGFVVSP